MTKKKMNHVVKSLTLENIGSIKKASINFGDLTVLVGPQATGKTVFLQFLKLFEDINNIVYTLRDNDKYWDKDLNRFLQIYFGEGMDFLINDQSIITVNEKKQDINKFINKAYGRQDLSCFYIPAQRYITLENGWPRAFKNYIESMPYAVREFGDVLNAKLLPYRQKKIHLFPMEGKLSKALKNNLETSIFANSTLSIKQDIGSYRIELSPHGGSESIPLNAASAGQREFIPYLYGLYYLLPAGRMQTTGGVHTVIIEELEMGLHPKAIGDAFLTVLDLLSRGYRVVMSTHSPVMIDYVWAFVEFQKCEKKNKSIESFICELFKINQSPFTSRLVNIEKKKFRLHYFKPTGKYSNTNSLSYIQIHPLKIGQS
ncbi:MAG: AAA family ATPase [Candidatus Cloacimonadaceae bacterium]|nr:AAA family ATPase [Candidatus Cloacimonadaceae bacterium]